MAESCRTSFHFDDSSIGACGRYCHECKSYIRTQCKGCQNEETKSSCKVKLCCNAMEITNCSLCKKYTDVAQCNLLNDLTNRLFKYLKNSDKVANIKLLQTLDIKSYAQVLSNIHRRSVSLF